MTKEILAKKLDGREYTKEITKDEESAAKEAGLVVIFGASDDLMEFRGAIYDECDAYDGGEALIDKKGLLKQREQIDNDEELEDFFVRRKTARKVEALWCKEGQWSWTFKTDIPHATFDICESDGRERNPYCRGIALSLSDC